MRHRMHFRKLNRTTEHRTAMLRNMAQSVIEHGYVTTTIPKAKTLQPYFERLVTLAVKVRRHRAAGDDAAALRARRRIHRMLGDRSIVPKGHQEAYTMMSDAHRGKSLRMATGRRYRTGEPKGRLAFTGETTIHRLIETVAERYEDRPGGYTRLVKLPLRRLGDAAPKAMLQLVGDEEPPVSVTRPGPSARSRRADARYELAARLAKGFGRKTTAQREAAPSDGESPVGAAEQSEPKAPEEGSSDAAEPQAEGDATDAAGSDSPKQD